MNPEETVNDTPENESEGVEPESTNAPELENKLKSAIAQKEHFREKLERAEAERKALEEKLNKAKTSGGDKSALDVSDYIDISTALSGLDQRQQAFLAEQHRLSGKSLKEIRESEDFQLWNEAYGLRQQKEAALRPNATQELEEVAKPFAQQLKNASLAEKEEMLAKAGLWKAPQQRANKVDIGQKRSLY